jgi:hypothetical protein
MMTRVGAFFKLDRVRAAIQHLQGFDSKWVIVPLVFAVNDVNDHSEVDVNKRAGTDRFLDQYFHGSLIGLPPLPNGRNTMRPRFSEIYEGGPDYVIRTGQKLWANAYSSRGYREMRGEGLAAGRFGKWQLSSTFWGRWEAELSAAFRFEELLVWLYGFTGIPNGVSSWDGLLAHFVSRHLGPGATLGTGYQSRFKVSGSVPWPTTFLSTRPEDKDYQSALLPSQKGLLAGTPAKVDLSAAVAEFSEALQTAGVFFGSRHESVVRSFVTSVVTKPFLILTGLSGSGKTQIALRFGEWLGEKNWALIPVRPDWVGSEAVLGYEDALDDQPNRAWIVPDVLKFLLRANCAPDQLHVLILDEMNLAHVERYFADFLSGLESGTPVLPDLILGKDERWRLRDPAEPLIRFPANVVVIGTVNVDETTYMFSPKVLDRANTVEFRVTTADLNADLHQPESCSPGSASSISTVLVMLKDRDWHRAHPATYEKSVVDSLLELHRLLSAEGFEFGHRTFLEVVRFTGIFEAAGGSSWQEALDLQILQKILPRVNGSLKRVGPVLISLGQFCFSPSSPGNGDPSVLLDGDGSTAVLPQSFLKLRRMYKNLLAYQFVSFTDQ